jgi:hypothetical protein
MFFLSRFLLKDKGYHKQYFETYFRRLDTLRSLVIQQVGQWSESFSAID